MSRTRRHSEKRCEGRRPARLGFLSGETVLACEERFVRPVGVIIGRALQAERRLSSTNVFRFFALGTIFLTVLAVQSTIDTRDFKTFGDGT